jgi:hypothetical protein
MHGMYSSQRDNLSANGTGTAIPVPMNSASVPKLFDVLAQFTSSTVTGASAVLSFDVQPLDGIWIDSGVAPVSITGSISGVIFGRVNSGIIKAVRTRTAGMTGGSVNIMTRLYRSHLTWTNHNHSKSPKRGQNRKRSSA